MANFAEIDKNQKVIRVIVAEQDFIDSGVVGNPANWIQTSYNTRQGVHKTGGKALRKNFAGVGFTYDKTKDAFIPPQPFKSWKLNDEKGDWEPPKPQPKEGFSHWDEDKVDWVVKNKSKNKE